MNGTTVNSDSGVTGAPEHRWFQISYYIPTNVGNSYAFLEKAKKLLVWIDGSVYIAPAAFSDEIIRLAEQYIPEGSKVNYLFFYTKTLDEIQLLAQRGIEFLCRKALAEIKQTANRCIARLRNAKDDPFLAASSESKIEAAYKAVEEAIQTATVQAVHFSLTQKMESFWNMVREQAKAEYMTAKALWEEELRKVESSVSVPDEQL